MNLELAFVDSIAASPTVRLNLHNDQPWRVLEGSRFDPPPLRYATSSTLLVDGEQISAAAFGNRSITLRLMLQNVSEEQAATHLQTLARELNRATNLLRYRPGTTEPVFFRTKRCAPDSVTFDAVSKEVTVNVPAEPFALGLKETLGGTLNANPFFETDVSNWTGMGGTFVRSTAQFHEGAASGLLTPDGVSGTAQARAELVSVTAAVAYRARAWVRCAAARNVDIALDWHIGGLFSSQSSATVAVAANTWTLVELVAAAPASVTQARLIVQMGSTPSASHTLHVDEATIAQSFTVNNDPTASANGMFFDITEIKGDLETPLIIRVPNSEISAGTGRRTSVLATRRRGTPANTPFLLLASSMTVSTDGTKPGNDANMVGSGNNYIRVTPLISAAMTTRALINPFPSSASVDNRGQYRPFMRVRKNTGADVWKVAFGIAGTVSSIQSTPITVPGSDTNIRWVDLSDVFTLPMGADPVTDGFSGVNLPVAGLGFEWMAQRVSGSGTLDINAVVFAPADEPDGFALVKWLDGVGGHQWLDGTTRTGYATDGSGNVASDNAFIQADGFPMVSPGVTNRVFFVRDVGSEVTVGDDKTATTSVQAYYYPRYISARPAST